jgi:outer membrane protein assembly factor BamB
MPNAPARAALLTAAGLALLAACATRTEEVAAEPSVGLAPRALWPKFRGDARQTGRTARKPVLSAAKPWSFATGKGVFSSPVIGEDGTVYVGSADRHFYALRRDGALRWTIETGEIVDSSGLLDDKGRVYFGSGDGKLRALDAATGAPIWTMEADAPAVNKAFINWFEGSVAIGPGGTLYVPNDNFFVYAVDREDGRVQRRIKMPDQTWSLPAVDPASGRVFVGNNNVLAALGKNTFAFDPDGTTAWASSTLGSIAASPTVAGRRVIVGGFDGQVRAMDAESGEVLWSHWAHDHVYASAAVGRDGTILQPASDGVLYALDPETGRVRWTFDAEEPIRSSPAVDGDGHVYFGGGDGRLYVLNEDGSLRFAMKLTDDVRNDLNASPALGEDAVVLAGESGEVFSVPFAWGLRGEGLADPRCVRALPARSVGAELVRTTPMGALAREPEVTVDGNEPIVLQLLAREAGGRRLATLDASAVAVRVEPKVDVSVSVAGDGRFVVVTPKTSWPAASTLDVSARTLVDHERSGLRLRGGRPGGEAKAHLGLTRSAAAAGARVTAPAQPGQRGSVWELARVALPMPTLLPSYNQIGFDSLHYLVGMVELEGGRGVAMMLGGKLLPGQTRPVPDPETRAIVPLEVTVDGDLVTLKNEQALRVEVMNATIPFETFRVDARLDARAAALGGARMSGSAVCAKVPFYGPFLQTLGLCNPQTDELVVFGGAKLEPYPRTASEAPPAPVPANSVHLARTDAEISATLPAGAVDGRSHVVTLLLVDAADGRPVTLEYALETKRDLDAGGSVVAIRVPIAGRAVPARLRAHVLVDTDLVFTGAL